MAETTRPAHTIKNLSEPVKSIVEDNPNYSGINCTHITEPVPIFMRADCEAVYTNKNNSWIVLGRDRPATKISGHAGAGETQCGMIDLVTGRMSSVKGGPKSDIFVSPNFKSDAARIYISQKTDIDKNFDLVEGGVGISKAKSGIGIKADAIRIIGREGIKLVTNHGGKNSQGGKIKSTTGIDLIAGNDDAMQNPLMSWPGGAVGAEPWQVNFLQPLVKGDNLTAALTEMTKQIGDLAIRFDQFVNAQVRFNTALQYHTHLVPPLPALAVPSIEAMAAGMLTNIQQFTNVVATSWSQSINLSSFRRDYLNEYGDRWICSRYNRTT